MTSKNNKKNKRSPQPDKTVRTQRKQKRNNFEPLQKRGMIVVGIGASAGGLKPLQRFFEYTPADTGLAFVVITHLHPGHESHLDEILQTKTRMPVAQVSDLVPIEPDHVYVIPPNRNISITDSHLETSEFEEPRGYRSPIDGFFRSLAKAHQGAVAIILSGRETDGSVGVKDIKQDGGLLLVQHPEEAEYDGMPSAAIQTGLADVVLPVRDLVEKLVKYTKQIPQLPDDEEALSEQELQMVQRILAQVHDRTGHDFSQYKLSTVLRRIHRRMQINGLETLHAYYTYMHGNASEATAMFSDILINVTNFFRDRASWEALAEKVIPAVFENKTAGEGIRTWSIGCATGEEAYSLAILLLEQAEKLNQHHQIQVFASDLDESSLLHAREGVYPSAIAADVSPERLERFFKPHGENHYQVKRELRDAVLFTNHSILRDPPFLRLDVISCRNMLIYLQRQVQDNIFEIFHYSLNQGGYIFLGNSESADQAEDLFQVVDKPHRIYQVKPWLRDHPRVPPLPLNIRTVSRANLRITQRTAFRLKAEQPPTPDKQHKEALEAYGPPSMLINQDYQILHISETAGRYLLQRQGPITDEVLKLVRPELQLELRSALFQAFEKEKAIVSKPVLVQFNGHPHLVVISVRPRLKSQPDKERDIAPEKLALVVFLEDEMDKEIGKATGELEAAEALEMQELAHSNVLAAQLEAEVLRLREQLQASVEQFDSSNEEMKAANEELQSINEEYRSTTEELETSKEELQSVNEELQTVNNELKMKLEEVSRANNDLENFMAATDIPMLFLDRNLCIQRFTAPLRQVFNVKSHDIGRPIGDLTLNVVYEDFEHDAGQVLVDLVPVERESHFRDGRPVVVRMRPYKTAEDKMDGVVITFVK